MTKTKNILIIGIFISFLIGLYIIYLTTSYQQPVYKTYYYENPVYKTENYQEPVYGTLYYGTLKDSSSRFFGLKDTSKTWTFDNAISYDKQYTRQASLPEYLFTITNQDGSKTDYYDIDTWNINQKQGIIRYDSKSRQVLDHYETKSKQIIDHYETKWLLNK